MKLRKDAVTDKAILPVIRERYSPRAFSPEVPEKEVLERLFEAARWTPSAMNDQPWSFYVGIKGEGVFYDHLFSSLVDFNQKWAYQAPVLILIAGNSISNKTKQENKAFRYDCGQAAAFLSLQAMHEKLYIHQMGGFDTNIVKEKFNLEDKLEAFVILALGYLGDAESLSPPFDEMEKTPRQRKEQADFVLWG